MRAWARRLTPGAAVIDLGCGSGVPITEVLVEEGLRVHAIDASESLVAAFERRFPDLPIQCEPVEETSFFDRRFNAVIAWGLMFLLPAPAQAALIRRVGDILEPGGRLLFTSPAEAITWKDAMTDLESRSLGAAEYRRLLAAAGMTVVEEYEDEGRNHYYEAIRAPAGPAPAGPAERRNMTAARKPGDPGGATFRTHRVLPHPPPSVFEAFARPDLLARWWGPAGFSNTFEVFEFRPGGRWTFAMHGPDGSNHPNESVFLEIDAPSRIVIQHASPPRFVLTVTLAAHEAGTAITWAQEFEDGEVAARIRHIVEPANEQNLDRLMSLLAGRQP